MSVQEPRASAWDDLASLVAGASPERVAEFLAALDPATRALAVSRLDAGQRGDLLVLLPPAGAAALLAPMPSEQAAEAIEALAPSDAALILDALPSAEQADVVGGLGTREAEAILSEMPAEDAAGLRALCAYEDDQAGGLMMTEYLGIRRDATVGELVDELQRNLEVYRRYEVQYAYVTEPDGRLAGVLVLRDLLLTPRQTRLDRIMRAEPLHVRDTARLPELRAFFEEHRLQGVPVVAEDGRLVGVVRRAAVHHALADASVAAYRHAQGIVGGEELRSMPLLTRTRRRLGWLGINVLLNILAAGVIAWRRDVVEAVVALAVFLPIISDMSGCSGNQAVAVSIRELSLGLVRPGEIARVLSKELLLGSISGTVLGLLVGLAAWGYGGTPWLGLVVGGALTVNTLVAVAFGGTIPLLLQRAGQDPALASGPLLTTLTDVCGFFLALTFAASILPLLTG